MMTCQEFQALLPPGLEAVEPRMGAGEFGQVFVVLDRRLEGLTTRCVARRLPIPADEVPPPWVGKLNEHLARLTGKILPHVSLPIAAGRLPDGSLLILSPLHDQIASADLSTNRRLDDRIEQLLQGLSALHRRSLCHGDVRQQNVFLDHSGHHKNDVLWLADAAIGPLTYWSGGHFLDDRAADHYPPEWKGQFHEPTVKADLYALGLTICELALAGSSDALPPPAHAAGDGASAWSSASEILSKAKASLATRGLVRRLLTDRPEDRPADAVEAYAIWRKSRQSWCRIWETGRVAAACILLAIVGWRILSRAQDEQNAQAADDLAAAQNRLSEVGRELQVARSQLDEFKKMPAELLAVREQLIGIRLEIDKVPKGIVAQPSTAEDRAQARWTETLGKLSAAKSAAEWKSQLNPVEELLGSPLLDDQIRKMLIDYKQKVSKLCVPGGNSGAWYDHDTNQRGLVQDALHRPWDDAKLTAANDRLRSLNAAYKTWKGWANDEALTPEEVEKKIHRMCDSAKTRAAGEILADWWLGIDTQTNWTLLLRHGSCTRDWGTHRLAWAITDTGRAKPVEHDWDVPRIHDYGRSPQKVKFDWKPGQSIRVVLEAGWHTTSGGRPNLIDVTLKGPLAPWRLSDTTLWYPNSKVAENKLVVKIPDCPGPPLALPAAGLPTIRAAATTSLSK